MDERDLAVAMNAGRVAIGLGLVLAPTLAGTGWIGSDASRRGTQVFSRALGARDLAIGAGTIAAIRGGRPAGEWLRAGLAADTTDFAATAIARRDLPPFGRALALAVAGGAAALGVWLAATIE